MNPSGTFGGPMGMTLNSCPPEESSARRGARSWNVGPQVFSRAASFLVLLACGLTVLRTVLAEEVAAAQSDPTSAGLRDAPQTAEDSGSAQTLGQSADAEERLPQTKRILGIIPNFRAVSTDEKLPRQTIKDKFMDATSDSFDYSSILLPGVLAAYSMGTNAYPEFHQGGAGYARYFWHAAVDQTSENYMVEFIMPVVTREDTRYYTLGRGGFLKRMRYALSRAVITRTDADTETFNFSEVIGAGASAGISSFYYPSRERSFSNVASEWGLDVGIDAASFMAREFWPDINRHLFHGKTAVNPAER